MKLPTDVLYILLDYCDPLDTNLITVVESFTNNETVFDKFMNYTIHKSKRDLSHRNKNLSKFSIKKVEEQKKEFEKIKKEQNLQKIKHEYFYPNLNTGRTSNWNLTDNSNFNTNTQTYLATTMENVTPDDIWSNQFGPLT